MNKSRAELWRTVYTWLKACGNSPNHNYCKEEITTHQDYPSLLPVIDFLDSGGMAYKAIKADISYIQEFNYPLLAHIKQPGDERIHIIYNYLEWEKQKDITKHWTGITVYPEKNAHWENEQNLVYHRKEKITNMITGAIVIAGLILLGWSILQVKSFLISSFGALSFVGIIISLLVLGAELGFQSQIVKQVCGAVSEGGCEKVLKSEYAKGYAGITPADISVLYFATQFIIYEVGCWFPSLLGNIFFLALAGIPIILLSIYSQAVKIKQWCALCLGIVAVLILQCIVSFPLYKNVNLTYQGSILFCLLLFTLGLPFLYIKSLIKTNNQNNLKLAEFKKWKYDGNLFVSQWEHEQQVDMTVWEKDILLGNPDARLQITVACNPYCGPCASAHKHIDNLLNRFTDKLKVQVRFFCPPNDENNKLTIAVKGILQKAFIIQTNKELQEMLTDWFDWMDFDKWANKWKPNTNTNISDRLKLHSYWIEQSKIGFTPTFFINGRKLPGRYTIADLEILIPQLAETI